MPILCTILGRTCRIPGCFNGSTEYVIHEAMPLLVKLDGVLIPSVLSLNVPAIPTAIYQKASKYVNAQDTRIRMFEGEGDGEYIYYFLSMSQTKCTKFTTALLGQYQSMLDGKRPRGISELKRLMEILGAFHVVWDPAFSGARYTSISKVACLPLAARYFRIYHRIFSAYFTHIVGIFSHILDII